MAASPTTSGCSPPPWATTRRPDGWFAAATALHRRIDAPGWLARTELEWGRSLVARGGRTDEAGDLLRTAGDLLRTARDTAARLGMASVERRAADLLS